MTKRLVKAKLLQQVELTSGAGSMISVAGVNAQVTGCDTGDSNWFKGPSDCDSTGKCPVAGEVVNALVAQAA